MYGSIATGLALDSSDMDLCICFDKYPFEDKTEEKEFLGNDLFPELSQISYLNVDLILDTEFPVIKIEVLYVKLRDEFLISEKVLNPEDKL